MKPDTLELMSKFLNFIRDNAEFKEVPIHEVISTLGLIKSKLERDYFAKIETLNNQTIDSFLEGLK